jgi:hypothetical protein
MTAPECIAVKKEHREEREAEIGAKKSPFGAGGKTPIGNVVME